MSVVRPLGMALRRGLGRGGMVASAVLALVLRARAADIVTVQVATSDRCA